MAVQEVIQHCLDLAARSNAVIMDSGRNPKAAAFDVAAHDPVSLALVQLKMKQRTLLNDCFYVCIHILESGTYHAA